MDRDAYAPLEQRLGYTFIQVALLERALTHKSFLNENPEPSRDDNERLEFLGDALLGFLIGQLLMEADPSRAEGELSKSRAQIVDEQGLAEVASSIQLGDWLFLGRGEEQSGGRRKSSLLADACEALMAAIYLDGGFDAACATVRRLFASAIESAGGVAPRDFKTRLQEMAQAALRVQPRYSVVSDTGPAHDRRFTVVVRVGERELASAEGRSKKDAEQRAAELALAMLATETSHEKG